MKHVRNALPVVLLGVAFLSTILAANWAVQAWGFTSAGFGLVVPAGTWFAGLALVLRDELQHHAWVATRSQRSAVAVVVLAVLSGTGLSAVLTVPELALASGLAFAASELVDLIIYTGTGRGLGSRVLSNLVAAPLDSLIFLSVSGLGVTPAAVGGQTLVKVVYLLPVVMVLWAVSQRRAVPVLA